MFFTREDILKIQKALVELGIKDTQLPEAYIPLSDNDTVAIVLDNKNKTIKIKDLLLQLGLTHSNDFLNITDKFDEAYITLSLAISLVPIKNRKVGLVITFQDTNGDWRIYLFRGELNQFNNETLWKDLYDFSEYIVKSALPDEEDITVSKPDIAGNTYLSLKDRDYDVASFSGMATKILRKNIVNIESPEYGTIKKNLVYLEDFNKENCIYEIRYDFDLDGITIAIPNNSILRFRGGSLSNGTINLNNANIDSEPYYIFKNIKFSSIILNIQGKPEWFGAVSDGINDDTPSIQECIDKFEYTVLSGQKYKITSVNLTHIANPYGRLLINKSSIYSYGSGICIDSNCRFSGGYIYVNSASTGITIGGSGSVEAHNRISVSDVIILGLSKTTETYGINCISYSTSAYNAFCNIANVYIYGCRHGFYGNIRSSYILVNIEGCYDNFNLTKGYLNKIILTGNGSAAIDDFPYFASIKGSSNNIIFEVFDLGFSVYLKKAIYLDGADNLVSGHPYDITTTDVSNTMPAPYYNSGSFKVDNPVYTVNYKNTITDSYTRNILESLLFSNNRNYNYVEVYRSDATLESYIEFVFGQVYYMTAITFLFSFSNAAFTKIEIRDTPEAETPLYTVTNSNKSIITCTPPNYKIFFNYDSSDPSYSGRPYTNLSVRCYIVNAVRIIGAELYASRAISSGSNVLYGEFSTASKNKSPYFFATDKKADLQLSKGSFISYVNDNWVDANGHIIDANYSPLRNHYRQYSSRIGSTGGTLLLMRIRVNHINPGLTGFDIAMYSGAAPYKSYTKVRVILCTNNSSVSEQFTEESATTNNTIFIYKKLYTNSTDYIIAGKIIYGVAAHMFIYNLVNPSLIQLVETLTADVDVLEYENISIDINTKTMTNILIPQYTPLTVGTYIFNTTNNTPVWYYNSTWYNSDGSVLGTARSGAFAYRPTVAANNIGVGFAFFCTDKSTAEGGSTGIMIYHKGEDVWIDALGRTVS